MTPFNLTSKDSNTSSYVFILQQTTTPPEKNLNQNMFIVIVTSKTKLGAVPVSKRYL